MMRWTHGLINRLIVFCDVVMSILAAVIARLEWGFVSWGQIAILWAIGTVIFIQLLHLGGAYRVEYYRRYKRQFLHLLVGGVPAVLVVAACYYAMIPSIYLDWYAFLGWAGLAALAFILGRYVPVNLGMWLVERHDVLRRNAVFLGDPARARALLDRHREAGPRRQGYAFLALFDDSLHEKPAGETIRGDYPPVMGGLEQLLEYVQRHPIDTVIVTKSWNDPSAISALVDKLYQVPADVIVEMDPEGFSLNYAHLTMMAGEQALQVQQQPMKGSLGLLKWLEDYSVAIIGVILVSPILALAALAIKLESPGPVMFRQPRVGRNNKVFKVYKLRTMTVDPHDDGSLGTARDNPRITRVGRFLRSTSIDELPQLFNVLKGDMSIVGPRPHVPNMIVAPSVHYQAIQHYVARYRVKPGITGWAQINGMRGGINTVEKAQRGVELDLYYIENWSIWLDFRIMLLTVATGMTGPETF
ncbi:MAG: exopolysaccharide biosynthesis polyprenyl glycosylphosphotransferase [Xanthobacter sp.]